MAKRAFAVLLEQWRIILISSISAVVFLYFDFLDVIMCLIFRVLDKFLEGEKPQVSSSCYCYCSKLEEENVMMSETLYTRKNLFRGIMGLVEVPRFSHKEQSSPRDYEKWWKRKAKKSHRWSDCGCQSCKEWMTDGNDSNLHVVVKEPAEKGGLKNTQVKETENVILVHGFMSSSSFWTQTVFPNLSAKTTGKYRFFAVDLLGFGRSPKPWHCFYTIKDHMEMIEKSVITPYKLNTFHLVAHSMGCVIALALAEKYINSVKSIVLIAPPYFPSSKERASSSVLERVASKRIWPPLLFGSAFMSWYEHLGRCVCFIICRHHRIWEWILKLVTGKRDLHFMVVDLTRHTHHSAWHSMHNVICGGGKLMDNYLEAIVAARTKMSIFQGDVDKVVPLECSRSIKFKVPDSELNVIVNADHNTVIMGREKEFTRDLESIWTKGHSSAKR